MKKSLYITILSLAALASCAKVELDVPALNQEEKSTKGSTKADSEITFQVPSATKSGEAVVDFPSNETFKTFAFYTGDANWNNENSTTNAVTYINGVEIGKEGNVWKAVDGKKYFWPKAGKMSFVSYAPATAELTLNNDKNSLLTASNFLPTVDLLIADTAKDLSINDDGSCNAVNTVFHHALSQVNFTAAPTTLSSNGLHFEIILKNITLTGIDVRGNLIWNAITNEAVWSSASVGNAVANANDCSFNAENSDRKQVRANTYFIPQTFGAGETLTVNYTLKTFNGSGVELDSTELSDSVKLNSLFGGKWESGKSYLYNISINPLSSEAITFDAAVVSWDTVTSSVHTAEE